MVVVVQFRIGLFYFLHPNVGVRATLSVLLDYVVGPYCEGTQASILYDRWFNQEQEVLGDQSNSWKQPTAVRGDESQSGDASECLFVGSYGGVSIGRGD